jgi:hypothetical protein
MAHVSDATRNQFHLAPGGMMALTSTEMEHVDRIHGRWRSSGAAQRLEQAIVLHEHVISGRSRPRRRQVDAWLAYLMLTEAPWSEVLGDRADEVRRYTEPEMMLRIAHGIPCQLVRPDRQKRLTRTYFDAHGGRESVLEPEPDASEDAALLRAIKSQLADMLAEDDEVLT